MRQSYVLQLIGIIVFFCGTGHAQRQLLQHSPSAVFTMADVLQKHALWLRSNGVEGVKADLHGMSLEGADGQRGEVLVGRIVLTGADLRYADFRDAKLRSVDFTGAKL